MQGLFTDAFLIALIAGVVAATVPLLLAGLGEHTTGRVCVYIKRLSDVDRAALEGILRDSYAYLKSQDGQMHRI